MPTSIAPVASLVTFVVVGLLTTPRPAAPVPAAEAPVGATQEACRPPE